MIDSGKQVGERRPAVRDYGKRTEYRSIPIFKLDSKAAWFKRGSLLNCVNDMRMGLSSSR